jgi:methionyl-tRNA formyltransferase
MIKDRMRVLLAAEEAAGIQALKLLAQGDHQLVAVLATPERRSAGGSSVWQVAKQMGIPTWPAALVKEAAFAAEVRAAEIDLLMNVHSLFIVNGEVTAAPRLGSYNLHPGPLPRYAGLNVVSWALYHGERSHGVTIHRMEPTIDTGPIAYQTLFEISDRDTALTLFSRCVREGMALLERLLDAAAQRMIPVIPQDLAERGYFDGKAPEGGNIKWSRCAIEVVNFVRACDYAPFPSPWGQPKARRGEQSVGILKASLTGRRCDAPPGKVGRCEATGAEIACADEWIRCEKLLVGGRSISAAEILLPGERLADGR